MAEQQTFLSMISGSFATPAAENPTVAMMEAAYEHHHINARYLNCDVAPEALGDAVRGARAMGLVGFNCSIPHKVAVIKHLDGVGSSAALIGAVNCVVRRGDRYIGENTDGQGFLTALRTVTDPAGKAFVLFGAGGAARAIEWALREARTDPHDVDYINAHGTSTRLNDLMETRAVKRVFGEEARTLPLSSIKSMVGHLIGASGAVEAAAIGVAAAAIAVERLPPRSELKSAVSDRFQGWLPSYQSGSYWISEAANAAAKRRLHTISTPRATA